jgi:hypothetical protein
MTKYEALKGHVSEETAYVVDDYPYGFRLRTEIRYWIETTNRGERFVRQTLNPKTGLWNKPKKSTYDAIMLLVKNTENGYISNVGVHTSDSDPEILTTFMNNYGDALTEHQLKEMDVLKAYSEASKHYTVTVGPAKEGEPSQTQEEQMEIVNKCANYELNKAINEKKTLTNWSGKQE